MKTNYQIRSLNGGYSTQNIYGTQEQVLSKPSRTDSAQNRPPQNGLRITGDPKQVRRAQAHAQLCTGRGPSLTIEQSIILASFSLFPLVFVVPYQQVPHFSFLLLLGSRFNERSLYKKNSMCNMEILFFFGRLRGPFFRTSRVLLKSNFITLQ